MAISWKWSQIAQNCPTRQIWGCFQHLGNFLSPGAKTVCLIGFANSISPNPGWSGFCSSWQCCRTRLELQLCQLHHLLIRFGLGDNHCQSRSISRWSRGSIQSWAHRRGCPDRHLSARCRPYAGDGPARQLPARAWRPRRRPGCSGRVHSRHPRPLSPEERPQRESWEF